VQKGKRKWKGLLFERMQECQKGNDALWNNYKRFFVHLAEINAQEMFELMQRTGLVELSAKEKGDGSKLIGKSDQQKQRSVGKKRKVMNVKKNQ
jgi:hypothetical protein